MGASRDGAYVVSEEEDVGGEDQQEQFQHRHQREAIVALAANAQHTTQGKPAVSEPDQQAEIESERFAHRM